MISLLIANWLSFGTETHVFTERAYLFTTGVYKSRTPDRYGDQLLKGCAQYLWVPSKELA
jgi:hypothetical protein